MFNKSLRLVALIVTYLLSGSSAWAHGNLGGGKSLWGGAAHFLTSPLSLAALIGLLAVLFAISQRLTVFVVVIAGIAAGLATTLTGYAPGYAVPVALVVVGLTAVFGWKPNFGGAILLAVIVGTAAGVGANLDAPSIPGALGVGMAVAFILVCGLSASQDLAGIAKLQTILPIARRVVGSWVVAIGLLMSALAFHVGRI